MAEQTERGKRSRWANRRRGFLTLDAIIAVSVIGGILALTNIERGLQKINGEAIAVGHQMRIIGSAADTYLKQNSTALTTLIPVGSALEVPITGNPSWNGIGDLQYGGGGLGQGFINVFANGGQAHLIIRHEQANGTIPAHLSDMIVLSGPTMSDREVGATMAAMEYRGGGIMSSGITGNSSTILGSYGGWSQPVANWSSSGVSILPGHVVYTNSALSAPISDYLNRYNTGNDETHTLHVSVNFNGFNADNMDTLDAETIKNTRGDSVSFATMLEGDTALMSGDTNAVRFKSGITACQDNNTGCGVQISDNGGFFDRNDTWVTLLVKSSDGGLNIANGNLSVNGYANVNSFLNVNDWGKFKGPIGTMGKDPINGYPAGWGGGIHTLDIYSESGSIAQGDGGKVNILLAHDGIAVSDVGDLNDMDGGNTTGTIKAHIKRDGTAFFQGNIGTGGFDPSEGLPSGDLGGVHTWDVYAEGVLETGTNGSINTVMGMPLIADAEGAGGAVRGTTYVQGQVLRSFFHATEGASCGKITPYNISDMAPSNASSFSALNGDIARDDDGRILSCTDGIWKLVGAQITTTFYEIPDCPGCRDGDSQKIDLGFHYLCALTGTFELSPEDPGNEPNATRVLPTTNTPNSAGKFDWILSRGNRGGLGGSAVCLN